MKSSMLPLALIVFSAGCRGELQAEHGFPVNHDLLRVMFRGNADGQRTVLLENGEGVGFTVNNRSESQLELAVRYSNDNANDRATEEVRAQLTPLAGGEAIELGTFESEDTGDGGFGWNTFVESILSFDGLIPAGMYELVVSTAPDIPAGENTVIVVGDGFGIEIDRVGAFFGGRSSQ